MPAQKTRCDSLREYLTGAASDGGSQSNANNALGNYRSGTEAAVLTAVIANAIANITIAYIGGANALGAGSLECVDANTLRWKCAGGSYGSSQSIANGETKIIETSGSPGAYLRVTRTSATALIAGTATITLAKAINNVFALDDVSPAEAAAGDTEYRATIIVNESSASVENFKRYLGTLGTQQTSGAGQLGSSGAGTIETGGSFATWPDSGWAHIKDSGGTTREIVYYSSRTNTALTVPSGGRARLGTTAAAGSSTDTVDAVPGIAIALDDDGVTSGGAAIQTIADESTAPLSVTWNTGITAATGLNIGTMTAGQQVGIWIKRDVPAGMASTVDNAVLIYDSFDAA